MIETGEEEVINIMIFDALKTRQPDDFKELLNVNQQFTKLQIFFNNY
jgi:hypothetical protein